MSQSLRWKPVDEGETLPNDLKYILRDNFELNYGKLLFTKKNSFGHEMSFLKALCAAKIDGAQELWDAIEIHGEVIVWIE